MWGIGALFYGRVLGFGKDPKKDFNFLLEV